MCGVSADGFGNKRLTKCTVYYVFLHVCFLGTSEKKNNIWNINSYVVSVEAATITFQGTQEKATYLKSKSVLLSNIKNQLQVFHVLALSSYSAVGEILFLPKEKRKYMLWHIKILDLRFDDLYLREWKTKQNKTGESKVHPTSKTTPNKILCKFNWNCRWYLLI